MNKNVCKRIIETDTSTATLLLAPTGECQTHGKFLGCSFVFYYKSVVKKFQKIHINSNGNPITGQKK